MKLEMMEPVVKKFYEGLAEGKNRLTIDVM